MLALYFHDLDVLSRSFGGRAQKCTKEALVPSFGVLQFLCLLCYDRSNSMRVRVLMILESYIEATYECSKLSSTGVTLPIRITRK